MKKIKYVIFSIILIIIILILILININNDSKSNDQEELINEGENELIEMQKSIQISDYFIVKNCIQNYLDILNKNNSIYYDMQEDGNQKYNEKIHKEIVFTLLNENYIEDNKINIDNIFDYVENIETKQRFYPIEITSLTEGDINSFKVYGIIQDLDYNNAKKVYYVLDYCYYNNTFCIQQLDSKSYEKFELNNKLKRIDEKDYNKCNQEQINTENIAVEYFESYKFLTLANPEITYNKMSEEYRNKRFGTYENYVQYLKDNYDEFKEIIPKKYLSTFNGQYTRYVIQDQYENNYIFDTVDALKYYVSLDTYTIEGDNFKSTYVGASEDQKVQMNIGKFFDMINRHDYKTSYNCLDASFKNNNMKTQQDFESIIKNNLFKFNKFSVKGLKNIGAKIYECQLSVEDKTNSNPDTTKMTIIMQLQEDMNFVMSFSF